jgi:acetyltransferase EpsM
VTGWRVAGFLDDNAEAAAARELACLGRLLDASGVPVRAKVVLCVGDVGVRRRVIETPGFDWDRGATVVHPAAFVSPSAVLGRGVFVGPGAVVHSRAVVGDHAIVNSGAIVEHDCVVGENSHVAPGAVLAGASRVGRDVLVGVGARVLPRLVVGDGATIGGGAAVVSDVGAGVCVKGVPAR